jgi:hypothetical protein
VAGEARAPGAAVFAACDCALTWRQEAAGLVLRLEREQATQRWRRKTQKRR